MGSAIPHSVPWCACITLHASLEIRRPPATPSPSLVPDSFALSQAALHPDIQEPHSDLQVHLSPGHWSETVAAGLEAS